MSDLAHETTPGWLRDGEAPVNMPPAEQIRVLEGREAQLKRIIRHKVNEIERLMVEVEEHNRELDDVSDMRLEAEDAEFAIEDAAAAE